MQKIAAKLVAGMAITAIGMFGADSSIGTWKFDPAKATSTATNKLKSRTDVYEAAPDGGIKVKRTELRADGTTYNASYTCKYDGKPCPVTGGQFDTISIKRIDANTISYDAAKTGGKYHFTGTSVISKDGKTLTQNSKGSDATGKTVVVTYIFDKQ